jgi:hypothetical protein
VGQGASGGGDHDIRKMDRFQSKLVFSCFSRPMKVTENNKGISLLCNLSIFCTLRIRNVLYYKPLGTWRSKIVCSELQIPNNPVATHPWLFIGLGSV